MARRIHILPDALVNQIAAGEVVERPASVVKELVENAIDAGARRVEISLKGGGKTEISIVDDGCGMGREDATLSLDRHATSKLAAQADLSAIRTLGFRGEALPSIASVARLQLDTAERDGEGTRIVVSGGRVTAVETIARQRGTAIAVRNLFFNVPARAKFLRTVSSETRAAADAVISLALAHPGVAFRLESNGRALLDLPATSELQQRISDIWGEESAGQLVAVAHRDGDVVLTGMVQRPRSATAGGRRIHLFVNGRPFRDRSLLRAADRGYRTTVAPGTYPSVFLFLELPEGAVDVNVHPAKAEVRFREPGRIEGVVEAAVRNAMGTAESAPGLGRTGLSSARGPAAAAVTRPDGVREPARAYADADEGGAERSQMSLFMASGGEGSPAGGAPAVEALREEALPAMWQLHDTYILAQTREGLLIVDQHSAHERVLFEEFMSGTGKATASQRLLFPLTLRLSAAEYAVVEELAAILARTGFEIEPFGGRAVIVHAVPNPHPRFDAERCIREMLAELTQGSSLVDPVRNQHERIGLSFACKAAIKAGEKLDMSEMRELFDRLFSTSLPYHDIHGRPTIVQLPLQELHARFRRGG
jgi:DNA mismatch repair protein MutL